MKVDFYKNYYTRNPTQLTNWDLKEAYGGSFLSLKNNVGKHIDHLDKKVCILEIGSGNGWFSNYCDKLWFKNYIWFDLDDNMTQKTQKIFPNYKFYSKDIFDFLNSQKNAFDVVFISHVFEHLEEERACEISKLIYESLKLWWIWINTMPNAEAPYTSQRYLDVTHKKIYSSNSFSQILLEIGFEKNNINHYEQVLGNNIIIRGIMKIFKYFHKAFLLSAGIYPPKIFTQNIFTIAKK